MTEKDTNIHDRDGYNNWFNNEFLTEIGSIKESMGLADSVSTPMVNREMRDINPDQLPILDIGLLDTPHLDRVVSYNLGPDVALLLNGDLPSNLNFHPVEQESGASACWAPIDDMNNNQPNPVGDGDSESEDDEDGKYMSEVYRELLDEDKKYMCHQFKEQNKSTKQRSDSYREEIKNELKLDTFQGHRVTTTRSPWGQGYPMPITPAGSDHESVKGSLLSPMKPKRNVNDVGFNSDSDLEVESMEVEICGPEYQDIIKTPNQKGKPVIFIEKESQMEWSHEMATISRQYRNGTLGLYPCIKLILNLILVRRDDEIKEEVMESDYAKYTPPYSDDE